MRRAYADTSGGQMHYHVAGDGHPLVLLHASPRSSRIYSWITPYLAKQYKVYAFDTLGFGASDPLPAGATMESLAGCVVEAMASVGIDKASVLGYHTGNKIGAALAANHPEHVDKFVLIGMTHSLVVDRAARDAAILALVGNGMNASADGDGAELLRQWVKTFGAVSDVWWRTNVVGKSNFNSADLAILECEVLDKIQARASFDAIYRANFKFDLTEALPRIAAPTLIIELATPNEAHLGRQGEAVRDLMQRAELVVFENTGRSVWEHEPEKMAHAVLGFLKGNS